MACTRQLAAPLPLLLCVALVDTGCLLDMTVAPPTDASSAPADAGANVDAANAPDVYAALDAGRPDRGSAPDVDAPDLPRPCDPPCGEGEVCLPGPARCVPDCRIEGNSCPTQIPECDPQTGVCHPTNSADGNLLCNPSFEEGDQIPDCWAPTPSPDAALFTWVQGVAQSGSRSGALRDPVSGIAWWHQAVPVEEGRVYTLSGHVGFDLTAEESSCYLQVVFLDRDGQPLERIDLPHHSRGRRDLAVDFPHPLMVRAPVGAAGAEVNLVLEGAGSAIFDDLLFGPTPTGAVTGVVTNPDGPIEGARVRIVGEPWGRAYEVLTDTQGRYTIADLPVTFARYILMAQKEGHRSHTQGRVGITTNGETEVSFELRPGSDPTDFLRVKFGDLVLQQPVLTEELSETAVIPADAEGYPPEVRPFLEADPTIDPEDPAVLGLAAQTLEALAVEDRQRTRAVTWTYYEWVTRNIDHDSVFSSDGLDSPYMDITSGLWQTIGQQNWGWGRSLVEWLYTPAELLAAKSGICIEHARMGAAVLRALNIPARGYSGKLEFWAQTPDGRGAWYGMSTNGGRVAFRERGEIGSGFAGPPPDGHTVTPGFIAHEAFDALQPTLFREVHPFGVAYAATAGGLEQALADLTTFAETGVAPRLEEQGPGQDRHVIHYRDVSVALYDLVDQETLTVRFPMITARDGVSPTGDHGYWVNHPECVVRTYIEEIENPPAVGADRWFAVELDLAPLFDVEPEPEPEHEPRSVLGFSGVAWIDQRDPSAAEQFLTSMAYADVAAYQSDVIAHMTALSARRSFASFFYVGNGQIGGDEALWQTLVDEGFEVMGGINPAPTIEALDDGFDEALAALVAAYPGITTWQLGNEPDLLWRDPTLYPAFFIRAQRVVRATCPDCRVVLAGISNQYDSSAENYRHYEQFLTEIAAAELETRPFDLFDFHYYKVAPDPEEIRATVATYRTLLANHGLDQDVGLICKETGTLTGVTPSAPAAPRTEEEQARDLARMVAAMASAGVEEIYFWTVVELWGAGGTGFFDQMGLIYNGLGEEPALGIAAGTRKKAYTTYRLLAEALAQTTGAEMVAPGVYRFTQPGGSIHVVWDEAGSGSVTLSDVGAAQLEVIDLVPDDEGNCSTEEVEVNNGAVTLAVDHLPRLVK